MGPQTALIYNCYFTLGMKYNQSGKRTRIHRIITRDQLMNHAFMLKNSVYPAGVLYLFIKKKEQ
jgi:hypothetical protein